MSAALKLAIDLTRQVLHDADVGEGHGIQHALIVMGHASKAMEAEADVLTERQQLVVRLAALLHDVDDRKFFPDSTNYDNARNILSQLGLDAGVADDVIRSISLVSCSSNGNNVDVPESDLYLLYPRFCDRLEAIGEIGVERCFEYNEKVKRPMYADSTPLPTTLEELQGVIGPDRLEAYMARKSSASFIDHFYDKLLHVGAPGAFGTCTNAYLLNEAAARHQYMMNYVLEENKKHVSSK